MEVRDFLNSIAAKAGKQGEKGFTDMLSSQSLTGVSIPDDIAGAIESSLFTIEAAKHNPALKKHFTAAALNGVDSELLKMAEALGMDEDFIAELTADKNTYQNIGKTAAKVQGLLSGLKATQKDGDPKEVEKYTKQINLMKGELAKIKESHVPKSELEKLSREHESALTDSQIRNILSGKTYANREIPVEVNVLTARNLIDAALKKNGAVIVRDSDTLKLKRADDINLDYYDEANKPVDPGQFFDKTLADNKMLAVSDPARGGKTGMSVPAQTQGRNDIGNTSAFDNAIAASLAALNS